MLNHIDRHFDEELIELKKKLLEMGDLVEMMVMNALKALVERDVEKLATITESERKVNTLQIEIDEKCLKLIALHQPAAIDLRLILGVSKINNELERVGDHSINISQYVSKIVMLKPLKPYKDLPVMADTTRDMFRESLRAFVELDVESARKVLLKDDEVDTLRYKIMDECIGIIKKDASTTDVAILIIMLVSSLEKIADHATNIAESVIFVAQGKDVRHHCENGD